jgi:3-methyladenine DNA glycosylase AlkC
MLSWSHHSEINVRRLASECCRPRLPWSIALPMFKKNPQLVLPVLENLKSDESEYVRRSIANNLNDIAKDHPELVVKIAKRWLGKNPNTNWIVKHACRTLLKKGNSNALFLHGFNPNRKAGIKALTLSNNKVKIGDRLNFEFDFVSKEKMTYNYRLEYAIDFLTSTGKISRTVFQITENSFGPAQPVNISRSQSFKDLTTRKHFKGKHVLSILANGKSLASAEFALV